MANASVTGTGYNGLEAGKLIGTEFGKVGALAQNALTVRQGAKGKQPLTTIEIDDAAFQGTLCDFTPAGGKIDTQVVTLEPQNINLQFCKDTLSNSYVAYQMQAGAEGSFTPEAGNIIIKEILGKIAYANDKKIMTSLVASAKAKAPAANKVALAAADMIDKAKVFDELMKVYTAFADTAVFGTTDSVIIVSPKVKAAYEGALAESHGMLTSYVDEKGVNFLGIRMVSAHIADTEVIIGQTSNMFYITDLLSDSNNVEVLDMKDRDGSNNIRFKAHWWDVAAVGKGENVVIGTGV